MFQMFAAKMFEQRVWTAFREKEALEKQKKTHSRRRGKRKSTAIKKGK